MIERLAIMFLMGSRNVNLVDLENQKVVTKIVTANADVEEIYRVERKDELILAFLEYFIHEDVRSFYRVIEEGSTPDSYFTISGTEGLTYQEDLVSSMNSVDSTMVWSEYEINKAIRKLGIPFDFDEAAELK